MSGPFKTYTKFFQGKDGMEGPVGPQGEAGKPAFVPESYKIVLKGEPGPKGDTGRIGIKGDKGMMGLLGVPGTPGIFGERGEKVRCSVLNFERSTLVVSVQFRLFCDYLNVYYLDLV